MKEKSKMVTGSFIIYQLKQFMSYKLTLQTWEMI